MTVTQDMIGHKLGEFAHTKKRFTYKQVFFIRLLPWDSPLKSTAGQQRTDDGSVAAHCFSLGANDTLPGDVPHEPRKTWMYVSNVLATPLVLFPCYRSVWRVHPS